jgi:FkbM family methyltransferase
MEIEIARKIKRKVSEVSKLKKNFTKNEFYALSGYINKDYIKKHEIDQILSDPSALKYAVLDFKKRYRLSHDLFKSLSGKKIIDPAIRMAFGVLGERQENAIRNAIKSGKLEMVDVIYCCFEPAKLNRFLGDSAVQVIPVRFQDKDLYLKSIIKNKGYMPAVNVPVRRKYFKMIISNEYELWQNFRDDGVAEKDTIKWLENTCDSSSILYDIGACTGFFSMYAAFLNNNIKVIAFEPHPVNFAQLNLNIMLNKKSGAVTAFPVALSDHTGFDGFNCSMLIAGKAENSIETGSIYKADYQHLAGGVIYTLDQFIFKNHLNYFPTHLKIDVDGNELNILKGAKKTLSDPRLKHLLIELPDLLFDSVKKHLKKYDFKFDSSSVESGIKVGNYIFSK